MELKFTVDTDDIGDMNFEDYLTDELRYEIAKTYKTEMFQEQFKKFATLVSETITSNVKLKMENFLAEEIVLNDQWGKVKFVGSVDDLIKQRFDEVLLKAVDSYGKPIIGCTSTNNNTWLQWKLSEVLVKKLDQQITSATSKIKDFCQKTVNEKLIEIKDSAIKNQVSAALGAVLNK